ncbi:MAG: hypothetical protein GYB68_09150 [Chloroflexi bacterium]|nr:hypothetical protein [Chloroflexota bacterium]
MWNDHNRQFTPTLTALIALAIALLGGAACRGGGLASGSSAEAIIVGLPVEPAGVDPHLFATDALGTIYLSIYDTLLVRDPDTLEFLPSLASAWTVSEDGLEAVFTLREDVTFHDGTPFNADAVVANIDRVLGLGSQLGSARPLLGPVTGAEALDAFVVRVTLSEPYAPLLDALSQPQLGMASPTALRANDPLTYQFRQVGTGPYRVLTYDIGQELQLERNEDYNWAPPVVANPGLPALERITFRFLPSEDDQIAALRDRSVDLLIGGTALLAQQIQGSADYRIETSPALGQPRQFLFNTARPPTDQLALREALILATDRQTIAQTIYRGYVGVAFSPLTAATPFHSDMTGRFAYDVVNAQAQLNATGWIDEDGDGWREDAAGEPIRVEIVTVGQDQLADVAAQLQTQWETTLRIQVSIRQVASGAMLRELAQTGSYNVIASSQAGTDPVLLNAMYYADGDLNFSNVNDPDLDALLYTATTALDPGERSALLSLAQEYIMVNALALPLTEQTTIVLIDFGLSGVRFDASGRHLYLADLAFGS